MWDNEMEWWQRHGWRIVVSPVLAIIFVIVFVVSLTVLGALGFGFWVVAKALGAVGRRLFGGAKAPKMMEEAPPPSPADADGNHVSQARRTESARRSQPQADHSDSSWRSQPQTEPTVHEEYVHLDVDDGTTPEDICDVMSDYVDDSVVGRYATSAIDELAAAKRREQSLFGELDSQFERDTMSWDRFAVTARTAFDAIVRNCALLANRVQSFDVEDYQSMQEFYQTGGFAVNGTPHAAKLQRWKLLDETMREMDGIVDTNEQLLLELGKLSSELARLSSNELHDEGTRIAQEVSKLVDETRFYR